MAAEDNELSFRAGEIISLLDSRSVLNMLQLSNYPSMTEHTYILLFSNFHGSFFVYSDENWWKGETHLGKGLFPASFVSSDLSVDPEPCELADKFFVEYFLLIDTFSSSREEGG